jgi:molybdopterin-guanine dinucleotide biosynthesis protein A
MPLVAGLFVGGRGTRLGGVEKGRLSGPTGERLVDRLVHVCRDAVPDAPLVLVGEASAYADLGLVALTDDPPGVGPLGGLCALVAHAERVGAAGALALACDLPYLGAALVRRLSTEAPGAWLVAPREGDVWDTLIARYATAALPTVRETLAAGERALFRVAERLGDRAAALSLDARERDELRDWDRPEDITRG